MSYTVIWFPTAQKRLAELWLDADDPQAVSDAADNIDRILKINPLGVGEERTALIRCLNEPPLGVYFQVRPEDRLVEVRAVWRPPASPTA